MSKHTPEPWKATQYGDIQPKTGGALIASTRGRSGYFRPAHQEDARRIAACVNACHGIPTKTLKAGVVVVPLPDDVPTKHLAAFAATKRAEAEWLDEMTKQMRMETPSREEIASSHAAEASLWRWLAGVAEAAFSRLQSRTGVSDGD